MESIRYVFLSSQESCGDQHQICPDSFFASLHRGHDHPAALLVPLTLQLDKFYLRQLSLFILNKLRNRGSINSGVRPEYRNGLLLAVISLADSRPLGPGVILCPGIRQLRHHLKLRHGGRSQTYGGSHAVISGVSSADDNYMLSFGGNEFFIFKAGIQKALGGGFEEIHRKVDPLCVPARRLDIPGI